MDSHNTLSHSIPPASHWASPPAQPSSVDKGQLVVNRGRMNVTYDAHISCGCNYSKRRIDVTNPVDHYGSPNIEWDPGFCNFPPVFPTPSATAAHIRMSLLTVIRLMKLKIFHQFSLPWNSFSSVHSYPQHPPTTGPPLAYHCECDHQVDW